jgi:capsular exopolysaccharide synthesis family protein
MKNAQTTIIEPAPRVLVGASQDAEYTIPIRSFIRILRQRIWVIALTAILLTGIGLGFSLAQKPVYEASIIILIGQKPGNDIPMNLGSDVSGLQQLTQTMAAAIDTRSVAEGVINKLDLRESPEQFLENLSVEQTATTQFIEVSYADTSPEQAKRIVNAVGDVFSERVADVSPTSSAITATVWERAVTPDAPLGPDPVRNGLLALVIGGMLGVGLAFLLELLSDSWRSPEEAEHISGAPTLSAIPKFEASRVKNISRWARTKQMAHDRSEGPVTVTNPGDAASEAYRTLRTHLLYALSDAACNVIVVTSPGPMVGKSTTCANLGVVLAQAEKKTLVLGCDFRNPTLHKIFGLPNAFGMVNVLAEERGLQEVWREPLSGLKVVAGGPVSPSPTELLGSTGFAGLLNQVRQEFDYILIDAPPVQLASDAMILSAQGDGVLLVIDYESTSKESVRQSVRELEIAGANVLGTVMNNVEPPKVGYYRYGYAYR